MDVAAWLQDFGLERYVSAFRDNDVDGEVLPELTADDLIGLGVTSIGHRRNLLLGRVSALIAAVLAVAGLAAPAATADTETVLYSFCAQRKCADGETPGAGVIMDASGHLYGTTLVGGGHGGGTACELTPNAAKTKWTETVLYRFCAQSECTDGAPPDTGLIMDKSGHLYGTTELGGAHESGTVFELTPNAAKTIWIHKILYSFCAQTNCTDGESPDAGLIMDKPGHLYGTTELGGAHELGTVFELTPNAAKTKWTETVLYGFCAQSECTDGAEPIAGLIIDAGHLYGTTGYGGALGAGTVFELTPNAAKTKWTETVLYSFCTQSACTDGAVPYAGLIMDKSGHLYGTTSYGTVNWPRCKRRSLAEGCQ